MEAYLFCISSYHHFVFERKRWRLWPCLRLTLTCPLTCQIALAFDKSICPLDSICSKGILKICRLCLHIASFHNEEIWTKFKETDIFKHLSLNCFKCNSDVTRDIPPIARTKDWPIIYIMIISLLFLLMLLAYYC